MLKSLRALASGLLLLRALAPELASADLFEVIPESHHQQYQTFGLFPEDHTSLLWVNGGRGWGAIAGALAILGSEEWKSQLVAFASANASFRLSPTEAMLLTETVDARAGLQLEHAFDDLNRIYIGWTHYSGHISDDVADPDLIGSNLGDELIDVRVLHDFPNTGRAAVTLRPIVVSDPSMKVFAADQSLEWYPVGVASDIRAGTPYVAAGLEEYGTSKIDLTFNAQVGVFYGEHLGPHHSPQLRFAAGFYFGDDPRLKYMQFKESRVAVGYAGALVDF